MRYDGGMEHHGGTPASLDRPADRRTIETLHRAGLLSARARRRALDLVLPPARWWPWADRLLLILGAVLLLAGVVFFFAYNWSALERSGRFALIQVGLVACVLGALHRGLDDTVSPVFLAGATVLLGVHLAVYGQAYQTGADAWELFAGWSLLALPWVVVARSSGLWVLWLLLLDLAVCLYYNQMIPWSARHEASLFLVLAVLNGMALALGERVRSRGASWLVATWTRELVLASSLIALTIPAAAWVAGDGPELVGPAAASLLALGLVVLHDFYRYREKDLGALTLACCSACAVILAGLGGLILQGPTGPWISLVFGLVIAATVAPFAWWLRRVARQMGGRE